MSGFRQRCCQLITENGFKEVAELGVWKGDLSAMIYPLVRRLVLVDPYLLSWNDFEHTTVGRYTCTMSEPLKTQDELDAMHDDIVTRFPRAEIFRMSSLLAAEMIEDKSLDMVFIDSVHTYDYCLREIRLWLPKVKIGGIIAGDDYVPEHEAVAKAVDEIFGIHTTGAIKLENNVWAERIEA